MGRCRVSQCSRPAVSHGKFKFKQASCLRDLSSLTVCSHPVILPPGPSPQFKPFLASFVGLSLSLQLTLHTYDRVILPNVLHGTSFQMFYKLHFGGLLVPSFWPPWATGWGQQEGGHMGGARLSLPPCLCFGQCLWQWLHRLCDPNSHLWCLDTEPLLLGGLGLCSGTTSAPFPARC